MSNKAVPMPTAEEMLERHNDGLRSEVRRLQEELETERMRLVACGIVAMADTHESAAQARKTHQDFRSASCDDVARRVDECMALRAKLTDIESALKGLRHEIVSYIGKIPERLLIGQAFQKLETALSRCTDQRGESR